MFALSWIYAIILSMQSLVLAANVILSVTLIVLVLIQRSNTDAGGAFSQDSSNNFKRRGLEATIYKSTLVVAVLFAISLAYHAFV
jgi:protein translocase SecG subunit